MIFLCCSLALRDILHTSTAQYSLFVLKLPLKTKQTNKQTSCCHQWLVLVLKPGLLGASASLLPLSHDIWHISHLTSNNNWLQFHVCVKWDGTSVASWYHNAFNHMGDIDGHIHDGFTFHAEWVNTRYFVTDINLHLVKLYLIKSGCCVWVRILLLLLLLRHTVFFIGPLYTGLQKQCQSTEVESVIC